MIKMGITAPNGIWFPIVPSIDDADDDWKDRYRDYDTADCEEVGCCDECNNFVRCPFEGYEDIGWCSRYDEFTHAADIEDCWEE